MWTNGRIAGMVRRGMALKLLIAALCVLMCAASFAPLVVGGAVLLWRRPA